MFDSVKDEYQEALVKAGHTHVLKYEKVNLKDLNKKKRKRQRYKHMFYFHPPHEDTVATKVGKMLLEILDRTIPLSMSYIQCSICTMHCESRLFLHGKPQKEDNIS